jgi:hypothetical protein
LPRVRLPVSGGFDHGNGIVVIVCRRRVGL